MRVANFPFFVRGGKLTDDVLKLSYEVRIVRDEDQRQLEELGLMIDENIWFVEHV